MGDGCSLDLRRLISLAVEHFEVKLEFTDGAYLVDVRRREVLWEDSQLDTQSPYFLCFTRKGCHLTR